MSSPLQYRCETRKIEARALIDNALLFFYYGTGRYKKFRRLPNN